VVITDFASHSVLFIESLFWLQCFVTKETCQTSTKNVFGIVVAVVVVV
jgi:hypothetical protein